MKWENMKIYTPDQTAAPYTQAAASFPAGAAPYTPPAAPYTPPADQAAVYPPNSFRTQQGYIKFQQRCFSFYAASQLSPPSGLLLPPLHINKNDHRS